MRIAITSQNFKTITGHAGQTRRFVIYEANDSGNVLEVERLDLPPELTIHNYHGKDHPLFTMNLQALITQSAGQGFMQRLAQHGINVHLTSESDPTIAVSSIALGKSLPAADTEHQHACTCKH